MASHAKTNNVADDIDYDIGILGYLCYFVVILSNKLSLVMGKHRKRNLSRRQAHSIYKPLDTPVKVKDNRSNLEKWTEELQKGTKVYKGKEVYLSDIEITNLKNKISQEQEKMARNGK